MAASSGLAAALKLSEIMTIRCLAALLCALARSRALRRERPCFICIGNVGFRVHGCKLSPSPEPNCGMIAGRCVLLML
jgi:hypothetical protein